MHVTSPRVGYYIFRAVGYSLGPKTVEGEQLDPLSVEPTKDIVNRQPELVALDVDGVVVVPSVRRHPARPIRIGPGTVAVAGLL